MTTRFTLTLAFFTAVAAFAAQAGISAPAARPHVQNVAITVQRGERVLDPNIALAPGVPVQVTVTNFTHQFHTFTVPGLHVSALILPASGNTPRTTTVRFTPHALGSFVWSCVICPTNAHGQPHEMGGALYVIINPSALP